jgi:hypothetical protein
MILPQTKVRKTTCKSRRPSLLGLNRRSNLIQVAPGFSYDSVGKCGALHSQARRYRSCSLASVHSTTSLDHHGFGQDSDLVGFATLVSVPARPSSISLVSPVRDGVTVVDMDGIAAWRVVAGVASHLRQVVKGEIERDTVGVDDLALAGDRVLPAEVSVVPLHMTMPGPLPAVITQSPLDFGPETLFEGNSFFGSHEVKSTTTSCERSTR